MDINKTEAAQWPVVTCNTSLDGRQNDTLTVRQEGPCDSGLGFLRWFAYTLVLSPVIGFGLVGNCIAFVVLFRKYRCQSNGILLIALTLFDTFVLCLQGVTHVWQVMQMCHDLLVDHVLYFLFYRYCYPISYVIRLAIMGITVCLSRNRWIAICRPFTAKRRLTRFNAVLQVVGVVSISVCFSIPRFYELELVDSRVKLTLLVKNDPYNITYRMVLFSLLMYVIPIGYVVYTCIGICRSFGSARQYYNNMQHIGKDHSSDIMQATRIMLVLCILTLLCNVPALTSHIIWSLCHLNEALQYLDTYRPFFVIISNVTVAMGSATNIVVYCWCSKGFRKAFRTTLLPCLKQASYENTCKSSRGSPNDSLKSNNRLNGMHPSRSHHTSLLYQETQV